MVCTKVYDKDNSTVIKSIVTSGKMAGSLFVSVLSNYTNTASLVIKSKKYTESTAAVSIDCRAKSLIDLCAQIAQSEQERSIVSAAVQDEDTGIVVTQSRADDDTLLIRIAKSDKQIDNCALLLEIRASKELFVLSANKFLKHINNKQSSALI